MPEIMPGAEPFFYEGSKVGCLLLHGFTSTPQEMRRLVQYLNVSGFTVSGPLLAGHGTRVQDLKGTNWQDWVASAHRALQALDQSCAHVFAVGLSLGGTLSLHLAAHVPLAGAVAMATPLILDPRLLWLASVVKHLLRYRKKGPSNILDPEALAARVAYDHTPIRGTEQALRFFRYLHDDLPRVHAPVLLIHSRQDKSISPTMMPRIYDLLGTQDKSMMWLENCGHIVTEDYQRGLVHARIQTFIEEHV